jgi:hypothetical protein
MLLRSVAKREFIMGTALAAVALALALPPAAMFLLNSFRYRPAPSPAAILPPVSVLIPARNEECSIGPAIAAALESRDVEFEIVVLDDHSTDRTAAIVADFAVKDQRVRLLPAPPLPPGWCGKQHACAALADAARHPLLAFVDADVRLASDALARLATFLRTSGADLVSGIPRQETGTLTEKLVIPLIHFLLLGFLPMGWMRRTRHPAFGAGCGQLFVTHRDAYRKMGGHAAVKASLHDGITLPRAYRRAGLRTDLCDATDLAVCRMYRGGRELWAGLTKNAREGLAAPRAILPWTLILFGGQVLPFGLLTASPWLAGLAVLAAYYPRLHAAVRFRQSWLGAVLHPVGILVLLAIQWSAAGRELFGRPVAWKGRGYPPPAVTPRAPA